MPIQPAMFRPPGSRSREQQLREYDARRRASKPWRRWYKHAAWQAIRAAHLAGEPLCRRCQAEGLTVAAEVVHHVEPHRGDYAKFMAGPFESLCTAHHNREAHSEEMQAESAKVGSRR